MADAGPSLGQYNLLLGRVGGLEDANADLHASKDRVTVALREARAEIARLRSIAEVAAVFTRHLLAITDALKVAAGEAQYLYLKDWYLAALADVEPLAEAIAKYDPAAHNEPSEVRHVSSSDSAGSGDKIS